VHHAFQFTAKQTRAAMATARRERVTMMVHDPARTVLDGQKPLFAGVLTRGTPAGAYEIESLVARGGCGAVYIGTHKDTAQRAAIKVLDASLASSPRMVERFVREVEVVNLLRHPNIVTVYDMGTLSDGRPFYAMEYLGGDTLDSYLRGAGKLFPEEAIDVLDPVCSALSAAHRAGIVHRDIKGSNVSICAANERRVIKLLDFGIAKLQRDGLGASGLTSAGRQLGSPTAMAPEQILGEPVDARTDIYALGVLLHKLLTGQPPFCSPNLSELARQHLEEPPPRPSRLAPLAPEFDAIVLRCMQKRPEHRFESVNSFRAALQQARGSPSFSYARDNLPDAEEPVVAVDVELRVNVVGDELDDEIAYDLGRVLDETEARLRASGFSVAVQTSSSILAVRPLEGDAAEVANARRAALTFATSLHEELLLRPGGDPRIVIAIGLHVDRGVMRGAEVVGGAILQTSAWAPPPSSRGLFATLAVIEGLDEWAEAPRFGPLVALMLGVGVSVLGVGSACSSREQGSA
jgi:eukaryotic-like serine/threonine-protein kinase